MIEFVMGFIFGAVVFGTFWYKAQTRIEELETKIEAFKTSLKNL